MNKKSILICAFVAIAMAVMAQVKQADFSSVQKALLSGQENGWVKATVAENAFDKSNDKASATVGSEAVEIVESISPSLVSAESDFNLAEAEQIAFEAMPLKEAKFTAAAGKNQVVNAVGTRAGGKVVSGQLISSDLNYENKMSHYRITLEADTSVKDDPTAYTLTGIY